MQCGGAPVVPTGWVHGNGSLIGGLFPQEICCETLQEKVPNKVNEIYMGMLCFAAFSISLITGHLYGIFRMQNTTFGHSFH